MKRLVQIETQLMLAELELDGLKTHITMKKEGCALYGTPYEIKIRRALKAVRSSRDLLRNDTGQKQWTITTRSKQMNRHGLWEAAWRSGSWECPFDSQRHNEDSPVEAHRAAHRASDASDRRFGKEQEALA